MMRGASWALWMRSYSGLYGSFSSSPSQLPVPLCSTFAMGNLCKLLLLLNCVSPLFNSLPSEYKKELHKTLLKTNTNTNTTFANCCLYSVTALYFCGKLGIWCVVLILLRRRGPWERADIRNNLNIVNWDASQILCGPGCCHTSEYTRSKT